MATWRLIETARNYWTTRGEFMDEETARAAMVARIQERERAQRLRKGRAAKASARLMVESTAWESDAYPHAVANRARRMREGMAV